MLFQNGNYYHLYNRGCNKESIFLDEQDYENLINRVSSSNFEKYLNVVSFCLMPNHYHFLVQQKSEIPVTKWIGFIFNGYSQYFNKRYNRSGTLFEGRVKSKLIAETSYLIQTSLYIHNNPVKAQLVSKPEHWTYSNYKEWLGLRKSKLYHPEFIKSNFTSIEDYIKMLKNYSEINCGFSL